MESISLVSAPGFFTLLAMIGTGVLVCLIALLVVQLRNNGALKNLTFPVYDYTVKAAEVRANEIVHKAEELARTIVAEAERSAAALTAERSKDSEQAMVLYEKTLSELLERHKLSLASYVEKAEGALETLPQSLAEEVERGKRSMSAQWEAFARKAEELQTALSEEVKRAVAQELAREMESVRNALASYRRERMELVERDIVAILEKATALVIKKQLSLKDHVDLARESLEAAKREGIFS
jgi:hypothetical protein